MARSQKTYDGAALQERLQSTPGWAHVGDAIERTYRTDGWSTTLMLVNAIGFIAEAADHHPDLAVSWGSVTVRLNTHSAGGITDMDLELAQLIERQALWRPAGGALVGTSKKWVTAGTQQPPS
ncbi:MAG: 4a-hydroxytetrahydrobiopterin dehydratase [Gemmatimonadales bacterium]|nr:4a-hydroxytetrahydrobiopterin dehydratase [Gemmatimonadales bacterium]